jgi:hypothetical protein
MKRTLQTILAAGALTFSSLGASQTIRVLPEHMERPIPLEEACGVVNFFKVRNNYLPEDDVAVPRLFMNDYLNNVSADAVHELQSNLPEDRSIWNAQTLEMNLPKQSTPYTLGNIHTIPENTVVHIGFGYLHEGREEPRMTFANPHTGMELSPFGQERYSFNISKEAAQSLARTTLEMACAVPEPITHQIEPEEPSITLDQRVYTMQNIVNITVTNPVEIREVTVEVPVERVEIKEVEVPVYIDREVIREVPVDREVIRETIREVEVPVAVYVDRVEIKEVEVPVEVRVPVYVDRDVIKEVEVPVYIDREVIREVPVDREVIREIHIEPEPRGPAYGYDICAINVEPRYISGSIPGIEHILFTEVTKDDCGLHVAPYGGPPVGLNKEFHLTEVYGEGDAVARLKNQRISLQMWPSDSTSLITHFSDGTENPNAASTLQVITQESYGHTDFMGAAGRVNLGEIVWDITYGDKKITSGAGDTFMYIPTDGLPLTEYNE